MPGSRVVLLDGDVESDYGEICITGPGLALGYYQDEALTAEKFVYWQGLRMYRTGDFARRTEHGLEFAGRADSFVKNRGFLVNLESEVIPILLGAGALTATAFMHRNRLVAFVTPDNLDTLVLRQDLSRQHDAFLVPDQIRAMEALPLTANGKADNRALQRLLEGNFSDHNNYDDHDDELPSLGGGQSKMEILKAAISAATLLPLSEIAIDRPFWELGGNSLAALRVLSYLRKRRLTLGLKALFDLPNLTSVCDAISESGIVAGEMEEPLETEKENGDKQDASSTGPMTALQTKMIQASLRTPGANYQLLHIHMPHPGTGMDQANMRESWQRVLERHAIFRTTYMLTDELQEVQPELELDWCNEETTAEQFDAVIQAHSLEIRRRMLSVDEQGERFVPVNAYRLVTVPGIGSTLLVSAHHAQADGWSMSIVLEEVCAVLDGTAPLPKKNPQFMSVALAQLQQQTDPAGISFWTGILQDHLSSFPRLSFPKPPPNSNGSSSWTSSRKIPLGFDGAKLEDRARLLRVTPSTLVYTAWGLVLSNYTSSDRVAFGAVFSGRNLMAVPGVERVVGPLLNTVPFPITFDQQQKPTVADTVSDIQSRLLQMLEFQWSATEAMASMAGESINGAMQSIVVTEYDLPPNPGSWVVERQDLMEFGLSLLLERSDDDNEDGLQARLLFDDSLYAPSNIQTLVAHFKNALRELMNPRNKYIQDVRTKIMDAEERSSLIQPGDAPGPTTVKDAFEAAAAKWPHLCAVESVRHGRMTYRELDEASNKVARWLRTSSMHGRRPRDVVVGVLTDGSLHWIVGVLAVLKAGCICCAIDVSLPSARIGTIVEQSGASVFLAANRRCAEALRQRKDVGTVAVVDEFLREDNPNAPTGSLATITESEDTIYLVFTSGSTGVPKGVPLHNLSILHVIDNPNVRLFAAPGRRIAQLFGLGFDVVLVEVFGSLCYGATLVLKDPTDPFEHLGRVNASMATPSLLSACSPKDYGNLDTIALAGEPVPQALADAWSSRVHLMNLYGPSECGPISTGTRLLPGGRVTIGQPLPRLSVYVLDHWQCLVPQGITGEIYISGEQMTRGYWNAAAEQQTKALFIPNPFSSQKTQQRMYRTGDLGFWNQDMTLSYVGRVDNQVKVRGFRIELEEIERALLAADGAKVQSAAAITVASEGRDVRIVAFVTPQGVDTVALRAGLVKLLPGYARPAQIIAVSELPKSANFKIDRKALRALAISSQTEETSIGEMDASTEPLTPTEQLIAKIWKKLVGLGDNAHIRKDEDFLTLGGNSLLAIRAARLIASSIGYHVPVPLLIRETVLEGLARAIDQHAATRSSTSSSSFSSYLTSTCRAAALADYSSITFPLSYLEEEMFHAYAVSDTKSAFNTTVQFVLQGDVNTGALVEAFTALVRENPILRARYIVSDGRPARLLSAESAAPQCYVGHGLSPERLRALVDERFDLASEQLFKVVIWKRNGENTETEVTMITHHIVTDKASLALMLQWVGRRYQDLTGLREEPLTNGHEEPRARETKGHLAEGTYIDWAQWLQLQQQSPPESRLQEQKHVEFWQHHLRGMQAIPQLSRSNSRGQDLGSIETIHIPYPDAAATAKPQHKYSQRLAMAATALTLRAVFGTSDLVLGLPYMNRDEPPTATMLGLFVDQLPIRIQLEDANHPASADKLLSVVTDEINVAIDNRLPYAQIKSAMASTDDDSNFVDVMVVYHWQSDTLEKNLSLGPDARVLGSGGTIKPSGALFSLLFEYNEQEDGSLHVEIEYNTRVVSADQAAALTTFLPSAVQGLAQRTMPESCLSFFSSPASIARG